MSRLVTTATLIAGMFSGTVGLQVHSITPAIACELPSLPSAFHEDPADRIIVSAARVLGVPLLTSDQNIIDS
jgi:PIN domain nuclease of toxin-antitoxin system